MPPVIEEITPVVDSLDEAEQQARKDEQPAGEAEQAAAGGEEAKGEQSKETQSGDKGGDTEAETVVTIGDEAPPKDESADNATIRQMRQRIRELEKEKREAQRQSSPAIQALGKKPTMADFDYDEEKFAPALAEYLRKEQQVKAEEERLAREAQEQQNAFQARLQSYEAAKSALKMPHIDDAEEAVRAELNEKQLACIIKYAKNPALVVAALGANPGKLKEFAGKKDLGEFVYALADVEKVLKVTKRTQIPDPEKRVEVETTSTATGEGTLDRLRAEAERTGDYTKVYAYKRKQKAAA